MKPEREKTCRCIRRSHSSNHQTMTFPITIKRRESARNQITLCHFFSLHPKLSFTWLVTHDRSDFKHRNIENFDRERLSKGLSLWVRLRIRPCSISRFHPSET